MDPRWDDFWQFISDVGERPANKILYRVERNKPYGPDNFRWVFPRVRMMRNLGGHAFGIMEEQRANMRAKAALRQCPKSNALFDSIKRRS